MASKHTAIEWLKNSLEQHGSPSRLDIDWESLDELLEQAKAMEKEQIMDAFYQGENNSVDYFIPGNEIQESEQYYNDIYKK